MWVHKDEITTGQIARELGVSTSTVVKWCDMGLLTPIRITECGYRLFSKETMKEALELRDKRLKREKRMDVLRGW